MDEPRWDDVLAASARLQHLLPDAVLVGGSAAALHAEHRVSFDDDHVLDDLRSRFDEVLEHLEVADGWVTARVKRPVLILGSLDGIETGVRQLVRRRPLDVEQLGVPGGTIRIPVVEEMLRVKAWLVLRRNATRDYLDVVALAERLGLGAAAAVLVELDEYYEDQQGAGGRRVATQLAKQLADPAPYDLSEVDLRHYRELAPRWRRWDAVRDACRDLAVRMVETLDETASS
jgi:hypothetical protein